MHAARKTAMPRKTPPDTRMIMIASLEPDGGLVGSHGADRVDDVTNADQREQDRRECRDHAIEPDGGFVLHTSHDRAAVRTVTYAPSSLAASRLAVALRSSGLRSHGHHADSAPDDSGQWNECIAHRRTRDDRRLRGDPG